jgi:hypothetical protein
MLIYACLFNCVDPVLTIAATLGGKTPLMAPLNCKEAAALAHARFSTHNHPSFTVPVPRLASQLSKSPYFPYSDHLTVVRVFDQWNSVRLSQGREAAFEFCRAHFLSSAVLEDILDIRAQFRAYLTRSNLLPPTAASVDSEPTLLPSREKYSEDLVRCALCAGLPHPPPICPLTLSPHTPTLPPQDSSRGWLVSVWSKSSQRAKQRKRSRRNSLKRFSTETTGSLPSTPAASSSGLLTPLTPVHSPPPSLSSSSLPPPGTRRICWVGIQRRSRGRSCSLSITRRSGRFLSSSASLSL